MIAVIVVIVIIVVALLALGMMQQSQKTTQQTATPQATQQATKAPVKSARPAVDLYVMSFCPYGTQAETAMGPVVDLLKSKADIRIRYITTISGTTVDSVNSLHGPAEAKEDLRQICINKYYPEQFWSYIKTFNEQCYPSWRNATILESCQMNTTAALSIDSAKIDTCAQGAEGLALLGADEAAARSGPCNGLPDAVYQRCLIFRRPDTRCIQTGNLQLLRDSTGRMQYRVVLFIGLRFRELLITNLFFRMRHSLQIMQMWF